MQWSTDLPKKPGYYWQRLHQDFDKYIVEVVNEYDELVVYFTAVAFGVPVKSIVSPQRYEWAGPILPPDETTK